MNDLSHGIGVIKEVSKNSYFDDILNYNINLINQKKFLEEFMKVVNSKDLLEISKLYKVSAQIFFDKNQKEDIDPTLYRHFSGLFDRDFLDKILKILFKSEDFFEVSLNFVEGLKYSGYKFSLDFRAKIAARLFIENKFTLENYNSYGFDTNIIEEKVLLAIIYNLRDYFEITDNELYFKLLNILKKSNFSKFNLSKEFFNLVLDILGEEDYIQFIKTIFMKYEKDKNDLGNIIENIPQNYKDYARLCYYYENGSHIDGLKYLDYISQENYSQEFKTKFFEIKLEFLRKSGKLLESFGEIYHYEKINEKLDFNMKLCKGYVVMELGRGKEAYDIFLDLFKDIYLGEDIEGRKTRLFTGIIFNYKRNNVGDKNVLSTCYQILLKIKTANGLNPTEKKRINNAIEIYEKSFS